MAGEPKLNPDDDDAGVVADGTLAPPNKSPGGVPNILAEGDGAAGFVDSEVPKPSNSGALDGDGLVVDLEVEWLSFAEESSTIFCTFDL